jgi:hypothetical protein
MIRYLTNLLDVATERRFRAFLLGVGAAAVVTSFAMASLGFGAFWAYGYLRPVEGSVAAALILCAAPGALALLADGEIAETAKLHVFPGNERGDDFFEDRTNQFFDLTARDARTSGIDGMRDFPLGQRTSRLIPRSRRSVGNGFRRRRSRAHFRFLVFRSAASFVENLHGGACRAAETVEQEKEHLHRVT